ncbi:MAG: hypothetical protein HY298_15795 [Verrucomicrobia bacterium]|nr:hypothetical protein [Verrucomicrobiota bacterium]
MTFIPDPKLIGEHRSWLGQFNPQFGCNWEKLKKHNPEAAMCVAAVRRLLEENGNHAEPNETLDGKRQSPDLRCSQGDKLFFVEVTCVSMEKTAEQTGLTHLTNFSGIGPLNDAIFHASKEKTRQCSNLGYPVLLAVGTFHFQASYLCFDRKHVQLLLTGQTLITQKLDAATGELVGDDYLSTKLRSAAFLKPLKDGWMNYARNPVSGILACGFGCDPPQIRCALHPQPVHPFDRTLLPRVECCRLKPGYAAGKMSAEWV